MKHKISFLVGALAVDFPKPTSITSLPGPITNTRNVEDLADVATRWLFWGLIVFGIVMLLVGGYRYAVSAGDPEKVSSANKTLLYATIAIAVGILAGGIPLIISSFFTP